MVQTEWIRVYVAERLADSAKHGLQGRQINDKIVPVTRPGFQRATVHRRRQAAAKFGIGEGDRLRQAAVYHKGLSKQEDAASYVAYRFAAYFPLRALLEYLWSEPAFAVRVTVQVKTAAKRRRGAGEEARMVGESDTVLRQLASKAAHAPRKFSLGGVAPLGRARLSLIHARLRCANAKDLCDRSAEAAKDFTPEAAVALLNRMAEQGFKNRFQITLDLLQWWGGGSRHIRVAKLLHGALLGLDETAVGLMEQLLRECEGSRDVAKALQAQKDLFTYCCCDDKEQAGYIIKNVCTDMVPTYLTNPGRRFFLEKVWPKTEIVASGANSAGVLSTVLGRATPALTLSMKPCVEACGQVKAVGCKIRHLEDDQNFLEILKF